MSGFGGPLRPAPGRPRRTSSDDPPPMSNRDHTRCRRIEQLGAACRRQPRLGCGIDDLKLKAGQFGNAIAEGFTVLRGTAGLGGDEPGAHDAPRAHFVAADHERLDRPRDRRLADTARRGNPFAETNNTGERVDNAKSIRGRAGDQEAAVIGAEIERRIGRFGMPRGRRMPVVATRIATHAIRRSTSPAGPAWAPHGAEAARRRCLVVHANPSHRTGTMQLDGTAVVHSQSGRTVPRQATRAIQCFSGLRAMPRGLLVGVGQLNYVTNSMIYGIERP